MILYSFTIGSYVIYLLVVYLLDMNMAPGDNQEVNEVDLTITHLNLEKTGRTKILLKSLRSHSHCITGVVIASSLSPPGRS